MGVEGMRERVDGWINSRKKSGSFDYHMLLHTCIVLGKCVLVSVLMCITMSSLKNHYNDLL